MTEYTDSSLAPESWESYIGQSKVKELIQMKIQAAMSRYQQLDHCLLIGESGSGKTSLANLIADEHQLAFLPLMVTPGLKIPKFNNILLNFIEEEQGGIVLLDEVHNFSKKDQHYLLSILENNYIALDNGKKIYFEHPITIVAATTEPQDLIKPLVGRFGAPYRLGEYSEKEMAQIVERMAYKVGLEPTRETCLRIGKASAGSPRQAKALIKVARDLQSMDLQPILRATEITEDGLTVDHIAYLESLKNLGMSAGLDSIANHSGRSKEIIKDLEKLLVKREYVQISKSGRELMPTGLLAFKKATKPEEITHED